MSAKKLWVGYAIILLITFWIAYRPAGGERGSVTLPKSVRSFDAAPFERWTRPFELNGTMARRLTEEWGITIPKPPPPKQAKSVEKKTKEAARQRIEFIRKGPTICRGKKPCYHLLGFFSREGRGYASFYAKGRKPPIVSVELNATLPEMPGLYLREAAPGRVVLAETNGTHEWVFGFFDVNASQYRPKEINASDIQ